jgi:hypothetical protein
MIRAFLALLLLCSSAVAQQSSNFPASTYRPLSDGISLVPRSGLLYVGPGDVVASATAWWGLRCYNTAYTGNVADVWDASTGSTTETLLTCSAGGTINQTINSLATTCAVSCDIKTLYDQTGHGNDMTRAANAGRPLFTLSGLGSFSVATFGSMANIFLQTAGSIATGSQPYTLSGVYKNTGASQSPLLGGSGSGVPQIGAGISANNAYLYAGTVASAAATDSSFHAVQGILNGASSVLYVDGSSHTVNAGTGAATTVFVMGSDDGSTHFMAGAMVEAGLWPIGFSGAQQASMNSNQHSYWSF